jgi:hypothetical protein
VTPEERVVRHLIWLIETRTDCDMAPAIAALDAGETDRVRALIAPDGIMTDIAPNEVLDAALHVLAWLAVGDTDAVGYGLEIEHCTGLLDLAALADGDLIVELINDGVPWNEALEVADAVDRGSQQDRIDAGIAQLNLPEKFAAEGHTWVELDNDGQVVTRP